MLFGARLLRLKQSRIGLASVLLGEGVGAVGDSDDGGNGDEEGSGGTMVECKESCHVFCILLC